MITISDIAKKTKLSIATVSHVVNGTRAVSEKSRKLVLEAIKETGYKPNNAARMLRKQRSDTVAMLIPHTRQGLPTNVFFMDVLSGTKDYLQEHGFNLVVVTYSETDSGMETDYENLKILQNHWVDGYLLVPALKRQVLYDSIMQSKTPYVLLDRKLPSLSCPAVYSNTCDVSAQVVHLLRENGKNRIGYIGGSMCSLTGSDRYLGYKRGLEQAGMALEEALIETCAELSPENGYAGMKKLIAAGIDGAYISNNTLAIGALECLLERGIAVPEQIGLVAFDDYEWMRVTNPPLTTVRQEPYKIGYLGGELICKAIKDPACKEQICLYPEIVLRQSHGKS